MGGFPVLLRCLDSPHSSLRIGAAGLIGDISQNNPPCQENMVALNAIKVLLHMIDTDADKQGRVKALYALSCKFSTFHLRLSLACFAWKLSAVLYVLVSGAVGYRGVSDT